MTRIKGVLFDLDGTLLDTGPDLVNALNRVRADTGLDPLPVESVVKHASRGAVGLLRAGMPEAEPARLEEWKHAFLTYYEQSLFDQSRFYPGIPELLEYLHQRAIRIGVVTNKFQHLTLPILESFGLTRALTCVVCGDTLSRNKPHPDPVLLACRLLKADPAEVVFVGDDIRDLQAGSAAGTLTAAVLYGYGSHELTEEGTQQSIRLQHPSDLRYWIESLDQIAGQAASPCSGAVEHP